MWSSASPSLPFGPSFQLGTLCRSELRARCLSHHWGSVVVGVPNTALASEGMPRSPTRCITLISWSVPRSCPRMKSVSTTDMNPSGIDTTRLPGSTSEQYRRNASGMVIA